MSYIKINYDCALPGMELIDLPSDISGFLDACYSHLECDSIEHTYTVWPDIIMILDECGKLDSNWIHKFNNLASVVHGCNSDVIVGNAILAQIDNADVVPLSEVQIERISKYFNLNRSKSS